MSNQKWIALVSFIALLTGCAMPQVTQTIKVPVPVPCDQPEVVKPVLPVDGLDPNTVTVFEAGRAKWATIETLEGYAEKLETAVDACRSK